MAVNVKCTNPECGAVFEVEHADVGQTVVCPECGRDVEIRAEFGAEFEISTIREPEEGDKVWHPARQQCPNCGAVLGVRDAFCPECGADIRTGAVVQVGEAKRKFDFTPFLVGGGVVLALGILVVLVVFAVKLIGQRKQEAQQPAQPAVAQPVVRVEAPVEQQVVIPQFEMPQGLLDQLAAQEQEEQKVVAAYLERLKETLKRVRTAQPDEMARSWAELYAYCLDNGLQGEAEQCWYQAARLRPSSPEVNAALGRTEVFDGTPVTPEQKRFLEGLRTSLRVVNQNPDLGNHTVRIPGAGQAPLPLGGVVRFHPEPGNVTVEVVRADEPDTVEQDFSLAVRPGLDYVVELRSPLTVSQLPFSPLANIYTAVEGGQDVEGVKVERNAQGSILSAEAGQVRLAGTEDRPLAMQFGTRGGDLTVGGTMTIGDPYGDEGQQGFYGSPRTPLRLAVDDTSKTVGLLSGTYYKLRVDLAAGLWGALGTAEGDFASEWARRKLTVGVERVYQENAQAEAEGRLRGEWEAQARTVDSLTEFRQSVDEARAQQEEASRQPDYRDRVRTLGLQDRQQYLYLNWPQFRSALAGLTEGSYQDILGQLQSMGQMAEAPAGGQERRGPGTGGPRGGSGPTGVPRGAMRPTGPGAGAGYAQQTAVRMPPSPLHPVPVVLDGDARLYALMKILPLLPDRVALAQVKENEARLGGEAWTAAIVSLEVIGTPEVVGYLGQLSQVAPTTDVVTAALLSLGAIGTPDALEYCDSPAVLPAVRTASMAAKAIAGDPEALEELPGFLGSADVKTKAMFLDFVCGMDTPATVLALSHVTDAYSDAKSQPIIAAALARIGGRAAMAELARLMAKSNEASPEVLADVDRQEALLLIRPLGLVVGSGKGGKEAAELLAQIQSEPALAFLKAGMLNSSNKDALRALLERRSAEALETAASGAHLAEIELLKDLQDAWFEQDEETGSTAWRAGIDSGRAASFLQAVVAQGGDAKVKIAAAAMLQEAGQHAGVEVLAALAREVKPKGAVAPDVRRQRMGPQMGPPPGVQMGPPPGTPFGPPGAGQQAGEYTPEGFQLPVGEPIVPEGFQLDEKPQLYALGLLMQTGGEEAAAQLRGLADGYASLEFKTAAMRALGATGQESALAFLRQKATVRKQEYADVADVVAEIQERLAALQGLGAGRDAAFLPQLYDVLHEEPPRHDAILKLKGDYEDLSAWWQVQLWMGACDCLSEVCRHRQLIELTADSQLQKQMARRLMDLIEEPGAQRPSVAEAREELKAEAVRAFGRCASLYDESEALVLKRLAMSLRAAPQEQGGAQGRLGPGPTAGPRVTGGSRPTGGPRPTGGARPRRGRRGEPEIGSLKAALRDALVHMAVRGEGLAVLDEMPGILPAPERVDSGWNDLVEELAEAPTPEYFQLMDQAFDTLNWETRRTVLGLSTGRPAAYGAEYARFVAKMIKEPVAEDEELEREEAPEAAPTGPPAGGLPPEAIQAQEAARRAAQAAAQAGTAAAAPAWAARPTITTEEAGPAGAAYKRKGPHYKRPWSYSLGDLPQKVRYARRRWSLVELLFQSSSIALAAALEEEQLVDFQELGPAIGAMYAEQTPAAHAEMIGKLGQMLAPTEEAAAATPIGPGFAAAPTPGEAGVTRPKVASAKTKRTAVAALRRLGGEDAVAALFTGLVGPPVRQETSAGFPGRPGMVVGPPAWATAPRAGFGAAGGAAQASTAVFIARALGSLGQADLLRQALNAPGYQFFLRDSTTVQEAALEGMAYLPAEHGPVELLRGLLMQARTFELRKAVADAILTAIRFVGASREETSAS